MFQTPTTQIWKRLYDDGKLNAVQSRFWQAKPAEELYDLEADPDEVHNLVDSPQHNDVLARLRDAHRAWASRIKDMGFLSEWEMHARSQGTTPYEMGHDPRHYDFDAIFAAANLATSAQGADLPKIARLLRHEDSGVRYWGAVGLLIHQDAGVGAARYELTAALADESPSVRCAAAEALGRFGSQKDAGVARQVLLEFIQPEANYLLAVAAWNALDYLDERARPALDTLHAAASRWNDVPERMGDYVPRLKEKTLADLESR
jgi:uncharacterized sulfatase